jgi:hypothetical protein
MHSGILFLITLLSTFPSTSLCGATRKKVVPLSGPVIGEKPVCRGELPTALDEGNPFWNNQELCVESLDEVNTPSLACRCNKKGMVECYSNAAGHIRRRLPFFLRRRRHQGHCQRYCECPDGPDPSRSRRSGFLGTIMDSFSDPSLGQANQGGAIIDPVLASLGVGHTGTVVDSGGGGSGSGSGINYLNDAGPSCLSETCSSFAQCSDSCGAAAICVTRALSAGLFFALGHCVPAHGSLVIPGAQFGQYSYGGAAAGGAGGGLGGLPRRRRQRRDTTTVNDDGLGLLEEGGEGEGEEEEQEQEEDNRPTCLCNSTHAHQGCCTPGVNGIVWEDSWKMATLVME